METSNEIRLAVVAGRGNGRETVGTISARIGLPTNRGTITKVNKASLIFDDGSSTRNLADVTVRHSEAVRRGYPNAKGCVRFRVRNRIKDGEVVAA